VLAGLDLAAGAAFVALALTGWPRSRRFAVVALLAVVAWFAGDLSQPVLLLHRPLLLHLALTYPSGRVRSRFDVAILTASWVGALIVPLGRTPSFAFTLAALMASAAWRLVTTAPPGRRREAVTSSGATTLLAASLAGPTAVRLLWPDVPAEVPIAAYDALVSAAALVLVAGLGHSWSGRQMDDVIELTDGTPPEMLSSLRRELGSGADPAAERAIQVAVVLLESNAALQEDLSTKVAEVRASRGRLVDAAVAERGRLEQILADGAQRYLTGLAAAVRTLGDSADPETRQLATSCLEQVILTSEELHHLARGLHPSSLVDHGLAAALADLASRSSVPTLVSAAEGRFPETVETALWYACAEAMTNLAKHSQATRAAIDVRRDGAEVVMRIDDNGVGGARLMPDGGLSGLVDRLAAVGGQVALESEPGGGTHIRVRVPLP
jgi:signal transduction histidine kinase